MCRPVRRRRARAPAQRRQRGIVLLLVLFLVLLVGIGWLVRSVSASSVRASQMRTNATVLAAARDALIGFAAKHATLPGALPCPDTNNDGSGDTSGSSCVAYLGRLPWKQLGLPDLRDSASECLWYAVSPLFRTALGAASRSPASNPLNYNSAGQITVFDASGAALPAPANPVIAVIIAPGQGLAGQNRSPAAASQCGGNSVAGNYLETSKGINNANGGATLQFINSDASGSANDVLGYVTSAALFKAVNRRVGAEIRGAGSPVNYGLVWYYATLFSYPWAASIASAGAPLPLVLSGLIPYSVLGFDSATQTWLLNNNWHTLVGYQLGADFRPLTVYPQTCSAGCLTLGTSTKVQAIVTVGSVQVAACANNSTPIPTLVNPAPPC